MARKAAKDAAKKKSAKQKKLLIVLAVPMLGALVYAYTTLTSLGAKPQVAATPAAATTPAGAIPTAGTDTPVTPGIVVPPVGSLHAFTALGRKDPFHDHGPKADGGAPPSSSTKGTGSKGSSSGKGGGSLPTLPPPTLTGAVISINGKKLGLAIGAEFGRAPGLSGVLLFRLIRVTPKTALIGVVGTRQHFTLRVRHPLTLQQNGGWTYTLLLEPLGSAAPMTVQPTAKTTGP